MLKNRGRLVFVLVMSFFACQLLVSPCGAATYFLATGQTGADSQVDLNSSVSWLLTPNTAFDFGGGLFDMKAGSQTTADVTLSLFQGVDATGTLLGFLTLTNAGFCAQVGNCNQFGTHSFPFAPLVPLTVGTTYFAELTSPAADSGNKRYFIKADDFFISDANGDPVDPSPIGGGGGGINAEAPEPSAILLMLAPLAAILAARRRT